MNTNTLVTIKSKHPHKYLEDKAYIALLSEPMVNILMTDSSLKSRLLETNIYTLI